MAIEKKILIIEDEKDIRRILKKILTEESYKVYITDSGKEGLSKIKKYHPELVILDLKLTDTDGIEVASEIRRINKKIKVIVITAYGTVEIKRKLYKLGIVDLIEKPFRIEKILKSVRKVLVGMLPARNADI